MNHLVKLWILVGICVMFHPASAQDINPETYLQDGDNCYDKGNYECALENYKAYRYLSGNSGQDVSVQIKNAEDCQTNKAMADGYYRDKDYENAANKYQQVVSMNSKDEYAKAQHKACVTEIEKIKTELAKPPTPPPAPVRDHVIKGRDVSFGLSVGMVVPKFATSTSGRFIGSVADYGYDNTKTNWEKPSYSSKIGISAGILLDIRLHKNLYLQMALNYVNIQMTNSFKNSYDMKMYNSGGYIVDPYAATTYIEGTVYESFLEQYKMHYMEIPLLFSYRIKLTDKSNIQINMGPYIGIGIAGKCDITGSADYPYFPEYNINDNTPTGTYYFWSYNYKGEIDLFGTTGDVQSTFNGANVTKDTYKYTFSDAPFSRINAGLSLGTAFEVYGLNIGISYDWGFNNLANDNYWSSDRMTITEYTGEPKMENYKHKLHKLQVKLGYIFRW